MKKFVINSFIYSVRYKSTSYYGNPSYYVKFSTDDGKIITGYTASNAACGYGCSNYVNRRAEIVYHYTRKGTLIIEFINDIKK